MTTTEEVIRLTREVADASLNDPVVGSSIVLDIGEMKRLIKLVKAEENEACAKVCDRRVQRVSNGQGISYQSFDPASVMAQSLSEAIRARMK